MTVKFDDECIKILEIYSEQENVPKTEAVRRGVKKLKDDLKKWKEAAPTQQSKPPLPQPTIAQGQMQCKYCTIHCNSFQAMSGDI